MPAQKKTTLFTLHFATINTYNAAISKIVNFTFTLHFATINTMGKRVRGMAKT